MRKSLFMTILAILAAGIGSAAFSADAPTGARTIIFSAPGYVPTADVTANDGSVYSAERRMGWDKDLRGQTRKRADGAMGVALMDRAISQATFTIDLPDGEYIFTVKAGDSDFAAGLAIVQDGMFMLPAVRLPAREFATQDVPIVSKDGKARITFAGGQQGLPNSMINSIVITPAFADTAKWTRISDISNAYRKTNRELFDTKTAKRRRDRFAYQPLVLTDQSAARQVADLCGKWLFLPSQELASADGASPTLDDSPWHVLGVPQFWNPIEWWIYMSVNGTSHNFLRQEIERCENFTFDYGNTSSGWYRQWIDVPASMKGKRLVLKFDAVASMAQVYWNGKPVRNHVGMFGPFECEVTPYVKFGEKNLLAVMVAGSKTDPAAAKDVAAVAVTVNVTREMLNSLPKGCYKAGMAGIWQPVRLEITGKSRIEDVYFQPKLDCAKITTSISGAAGLEWGVRHALVDAGTGAELKAESSGISYSEDKVAQVHSMWLGECRPKLWSPEHPNLYRLKTQLLVNGKVVDEKTTTVGFKTFVAKGDRLYLNGKPYFIRGADQPPHGLTPNEKPLADKFMKMMHDGNTMVTRFHVAPPSQVWLDAADKYGVGSSVGEDWPWVLMGTTPLPDSKALAVWKSEFAEIVKANRNHPSLMLWTISNESYFQGDEDANRRQEKYRLFSDIIKDTRKLAPGIPIVLHSGYTRNKDYYEKTMKPNELDDGDVDDGHFYFGWYEKHPFRVNVPMDVERRSQTPRPFISQEASTGYPDNDTGHPTESYIRDHVVPQAWVGKYGTYAERPDSFLDIHSQITKEYLETIRRNRTFLSGWMIFSNTCWFKDVYDAERITPYPVYGAVQKAWSPVLVSLVRPDRHFEAGQRFISKVVVCNDDPDRPNLTNLTLKWHIYGKSSDMGASGTLAFPDCAYDGKSQTTVECVVPDKLPQPRADMTLELQLFQGDELISRNDYPLICAAREWSTVGKGKLIVLENDSTAGAYLNGLGYECETAKSADFASLSADAVVIAAPSVDGQGMLDPLSAFVQRGGRVLFLAQPTAGLPNLSADKKLVDASGDFADVLEPSLLDGMDPMDMHWWNAESGDVPRVCAKAYKLSDGQGITKLVQHIQPHGYLHGANAIDEFTSWPVFEYTVGKGRIMVSSMRLADDPISKRFTANLLRYLMRP